MSEFTGKTVEVADWERRALALESEHQFDAAREAFDAALRLDPSSQSLAEGRARVAIQSDENDAADHCARALAFHDADPELQLQMIEVATAALGEAAMPLLESYLDRHPENVTALELLASLRSQAGEGDRFVDRYRRVLESSPEDKCVLMSFWNTLSRARHYDEALDSMDRNRALFEGDRDFDLLEINIANHAGFTDLAGKALDRLDEAPDAQLARGQHRLQTNRPVEAAVLLEKLVEKEPDNISAWALLEVAWRLTEDKRHDWLAGQAGLVGSLDLNLSSTELSTIATMLRKVHRSQSQPLGQSVRGGTQTPGQLFIRNEPEIGLLTNALAECIRQFHSKLPPFDPRHPLLKYRNHGLAFGPSWSVMLSGGGYHAAHFHPGGVLSSACYISLPDVVSKSTDQQGWLEIGCPPTEMGIDLPAIATFEPKPGRLVLFPSYLFHGTRPFSAGERLTAAFDLVPVPMNG